MVEALRQDDGDAARANFSTQAKNLMSNIQLTGNWDIDMGVFGDFKNVEGQTKRGVAGTMLYVTALRYARGMFEVRLQFDSNDQIINFWFATMSGRNARQLEQEGGSLDTSHQAAQPQKLTMCEVECEPCLVEVIKSKAG